MSAAHSTGAVGAPIFTSEPEGFAHRLTRVAEAIGRALRAGAPEPAMVSVSDATLSITPWHPGAPLQGLLLWAEHLQDAEWSAQVHPPFGANQSVATSLYVRGTLAGLPVELSSSSYRPIPGVAGHVGERQPVDPMELARLAGQEQPYAEAGR